MAQTEADGFLVGFYPLDNFPKVGARLAAVLSVAIFPILIDLRHIGAGIGIFSLLVASLIIISIEFGGIRTASAKYLEISKSIIVVVIILLTITSSQVEIRVAESVVSETNSSNTIYTKIPDFYSTIESDGDELSVAFIGTSVSKDGIASRCIENRTAEMGFEINVYNLAIPGDDMVLRLPELGLIKSSGIEMVAIEVSPNLIRNFWIGGATSYENGLKFNARMLLYDTDYSEMSSLTGDEQIEKWMEVENVELISLAIVPRYFPNLLEADIMALFGEDDSIEGQLWKINAKSNGSNRAFDSEASKTLADRIEAVFISNPDIEPYTTSWGQIPDYQNYDEPNGVNHLALVNFVDALTEHGTMVLLFTPPAHPVIAEHLGDDWQKLSAISSGISDGNEMVQWLDMRGMENSNDFWVDDHHPNVLGKTAFCEYLSSGIVDYLDNGLLLAR